MKISFIEYDKLVGELSQIQNTDAAWWPVLCDIETNINPDKEDDILFLLWLLITADTPHADGDAKTSRKAIRQLLYVTIQLDE